MKRYFAAILLLFIFTVSATAQNISEEEKLKAIREKLEASKRELARAKEQEQAVLGNLTVINKELKRTKQNLFLAQRKINDNESKIGTLTSELKIIEGTLRKEQGDFMSRIREAYKSSGLNYLEIILSSQSLSDFFNRAYFLKKIVDYDAELVQGVQGDFQKAKEKRETLKDKNQEIRSLAMVIASKKAEFSAKMEEKKKIYDSLKQRRQAYEAQVAELEQSSKELEVLILKKLAERKGGKVRGSGELAWPLSGRLTSNYGYRRHPLWGGRNFHTGIDIAAQYGTPIRSADSGEIIFAGWWDGYGKAIVIDHGRNTSTVYGHLSRIYKKVGDVIAKGQIIGLVGSTGYSTGPHLHFEVRKSGKPVNPVLYL